MASEWSRLRSRWYLLASIAVHGIPLLIFSQIVTNQESMVPIDINEVGPVIDLKRIVHKQKIQTVGSVAPNRSPVHVNESAQNTRINSSAAEPELLGESTVETLRHGNPKPVYPRLSRIKGEQGRVVVKVSISPSGNVQSADIEVSSGYERLDESAKMAVLQWRFPESSRLRICSIGFRFSLSSLHETTDL